MDDVKLVVRFGALAEQAAQTAARARAEGDTARAREARAAGMIAAEFLVMLLEGEGEEDED